MPRDNGVPLICAQLRHKSSPGANLTSSIVRVWAASYEPDLWLDLYAQSRSPSHTLHPTPACLRGVSYTPYFSGLRVDIMYANAYFFMQTPAVTNFIILCKQFLICLIIIQLKHGILYPLPHKSDFWFPSCTPPLSFSLPRLPFFSPSPSSGRDRYL